MLCGSSIHPARCPRVFGSVAGGDGAARLRGASGRARRRRRRSCRGSCGTGCTSSCRNTSAPAPARRRLRQLALPAAGASATPRSPSFGFGDDVERHLRVLHGRRTPRTGRDTTPGLSACSQIASCSPGSDRACRAGSAPRSCGSRRATCTFNTTGRPTGMWISLAVAEALARASRLGTATSHHHWWPVSLIVTALLAPSDATARPVQIARDEQHEQRDDGRPPTATVTPTCHARLGLRPARRARRRSWLRASESATQRDDHRTHADGADARTSASQSRVDVAPACGAGWTRAHDCRRAAAVRAISARHARRRHRRRSSAAQPRRGVLGRLRRPCDRCGSAPTSLRRQPAHASARRRRAARSGGPGSCRAERGHAVGPALDEWSR